MKTVSNNSHPAQAYKKIDNIKIKRNVSLFSSTYLSSFYCSPLPIFSFLHGSEAAFRCCEIKVHVGDLLLIIDTIFINPVENIVDMWIELSLCSISS